MEYRITVLKGDGIGPEIVDEALKTLAAVGRKFGHEFMCTDALIGGAAIDETGVPLPQKTIDACLASDSVLLGAVGGPTWDAQPADNRPERGLLGIRKAMGSSRTCALPCSTRPWPMPARSSPSASRTALIWLSAVN